MIAATPLSTNVNERRTGILLKKLMLPNPAFKLHRELSDGRNNVETYIANHFEREYGARIGSFLPMLITMQCRSDYSAAMGIRSAAQSPLYLEQYLNSTIEASIELAANTPASVKRSEIVEIGNLVATRRGASQLMFILVAAALIKTDAKWMVFTATPQVAKILRRLKFKTITLCEADQNRLSDQSERDQWGEYYNSHPQVLAGDLTQVYDLIQNSRLLRHVVKHYDDVVQKLSNYLKP